MIAFLVLAAMITVYFIFELRIILYTLQEILTAIEELDLGGSPFIEPSNPDSMTATRSTEFFLKEGIQESNPEDESGQSETES